jgi:type III pantothenate kinase
MKNLIIDIGNSAIKTGFADRKLNKNTCRTILYSKKKFSEEFTDFLKSFGFRKMNSGITETGISLVDDSLKDKCRKIIREHLGKEPVFINQDLELPIKIKYEKSLGADRICSAAAANELYKSKHILVIDFGTATTYNIISNGTYAGGIISPGIETSLNSLIKNTALPYPANVKKFRLMSQNTNSAILSGVFLSVKYTAEGVINTLHRKFIDLTVVATGGLSLNVTGLVEGIDYYNRFLVLEGINIILNHVTSVRKSRSEI